MAYVNGKTWRQLHLRRMKYMYGRLVEAWEGKYTDDRGALCLTYRAMEAALRSLPAEPGSVRQSRTEGRGHRLSRPETRGLLPGSIAGRKKYVQVAMDEKLRQDRARMDRIAKRYGEGARQA